MAILKQFIDDEEEIPEYINRLSTQSVDNLYQMLMNEIVVHECFLDSTLTAQALAKKLNINARSISAVMALRFNSTFTATINYYRIQRAIYMMKDKRYTDLNCADIGFMCGFANKQSFYTAFHKHIGITPAAYKKALKINHH